MPKDRDLSFDAFRGLAIIAVVAIHAVYLGGSLHKSAWLSYCQFLIFAVPAFLFMSGYWSSKENVRSLADYRAFLAKRFSRILIPYLFWSSILIGYSLVRSRNVDGYKIICTFLTGGAGVGYYFIIVLAQQYIITPFLVYINRRLNVYGLVLVAVFNVGSLLILYFSRLLNVTARIPLVLPFYSWIIYYELGLYVGERYNKISAASKIRVGIPVAAIIFGVLSAIEANFIMSRYGNLAFAGMPIKFSSLLYSLCIIFLFLSAKEYFGRLPGVLAEIGYNSFGIYFIHAIVLNQLIRVFQENEKMQLYQPLYQLLLVAATLFICLVLIGIARRLLPGSFCVKILGFGSRRRCSEDVCRGIGQSEQAKVGCGVEEV